MTSRRRTRRTLAIGSTVLLLGAVLIGVRAARTEASPVAQGARLARESGCFACHGHDDLEHRANYRRTSSGEWRARGIPTLWENGIDEASVLIAWITHGCPPEERERHERLFIQMPAYGDGRLAPEEIDAIAAWILAEGLQRTLAAGDEVAFGAEDPAPATALTPEQLLRHGDRLSREHGCYQCHGELGQGGVPNPGSFKSYIPGFFGADFLALTDGGDPAEIRHWIDHGRGRAIETGPFGRIARRFLDRQAIGMPAYRDRLSAGEKDLLTEYLLLLNSRGGLSAQAVEATARALIENDS